MLTRCWLPPESVADLIVAAVGEGGLLEHPLDRRLDVVGTFSRRAKRRRFSATVSRR